jgi:IS4 transposase
MVNLQKKAENPVSESNLLFAELLEIESLGKESGFYRRKPKKITAIALFYSFWKMQAKGKNSLENWAFYLGRQIGQPITRQSLNERLNEKSVALGKMVLIKALNLKPQPRKQKISKKLKDKLKIFNRVFIRDSTVQQLPDYLSDIFPGSFSHGNATALARIQALYNFTDLKWTDFQIGAFTDNDQGAANCVRDFLRPKDLLLQDLGYFTLDWIKELIQEQYLITKWQPGTHLFTENGIKINLAEELEDKKGLDIPVLVGAKHKIPMRLVVRKLPKKQAKKRIESAEKDRHSKSNHSKEYLELLKYEIYLTNIALEDLNAKEIAKLYGLRWYIEILFKSWKSYANFTKMFKKEKVQLNRVLFTIYALLIEFTYLTTVIYSFIQNEIRQKSTKILSILKFKNTANNCMADILNIQCLSELIPIIPFFIAHATYEKHTKRQNMLEKYLYVNELCI